MIRRRFAAAVLVSWMTAIPGLAIPAVGQAARSLADPDASSIRLAFEVASVKPNRSNEPATSRFPLGSGDGYAPGNRFSARNQPLIVYLRFAYKLGQSDLDELPAWVFEERFDIEARATGNPGKDQMRRMMQSLLADRFKVASHVEPRTQSVFNLELVKAGALGPGLRRHPDDGACGSAAERSRDAIPCDSLGPVPASAAGRGRLEGRNVTMARVAGFLMNPFTGIDRPVLDRTGLSGTFDVSIEWALPPDPGQPPGAAVDEPGPRFADALREQLGLKLTSARGQVGVLAIDHVERPTPD